MIAFPALTAVLLGALPSQAESTARISGLASSSYNGQPIAGVMVSLPAAGKYAVTDSGGAFSLDGLPTGAQNIRITYVDRQTEAFVFHLEPGVDKQIVVLLDVDSVGLDPVVVEVRHPDQWRDLAGFYARRAIYRGFGHFYTREEISRSRPSAVSALLALDGIMVRCVRECLPVRYVQNVPCIVPVSVDGHPFREVDYDLLPIASVAGVEVYRGTPPSGLSVVTEQTTPNSVWQRGPYNSSGTCGSVMIWTR